MRQLLKIVKNEAGRQNEILIVATLLGIILAIVISQIISNYSHLKEIGLWSLIPFVLSSTVLTILIIIGLIVIFGCAFLLLRWSFLKIKSLQRSKGGYARFEKRI